MGWLATKAKGTFSPQCSLFHQGREYFPRVPVYFSYISLAILSLKPNPKPISDNNNKGIKTDLIQS
jgi:hypothetical protein